MSVTNLSLLESSNKEAPRPHDVQNYERKIYTPHKYLCDVSLLIEKINLDLNEKGS